MAGISVCREYSQRIDVALPQAKLYSLVVVRPDRLNPAFLLQTNVLVLCILGL